MGKPVQAGSADFAKTAASSCTAAGMADVSTTASECVKAAESAGYDFTVAKAGGAKVPVIHDPGQTYPRVCVVCENMIYANRPDLLFFDKAKGASSCDQDGKQTKINICRRT